MRFVLPDETNRQDVLDFYVQFDKNGETCIGFASHDDYDTWLMGMRNRRTGKNLPEGYVRENFYLCYEEEKMVGVFSLKFELTPYLLNYGGHIGYAVAPEQRRRGLATRMLARGKDIARELGFDKLLLVCDDDNIASEKTILNNGGKYEDSRFDEEEGVTVKRYWIILSKAPDSICADRMTDDQIHEKLAQGYADMEKGRIQPAAKAFMQD